MIPWAMLSLVWAQTPERLDVEAHCGTVSIMAAEGDWSVNSVAGVTVRKGTRARVVVAPNVCPALEIRVPAEVRVEVHTISASLSLVGMSGRVGFTSVSGDLRVSAAERSPSELSVSLVTGDAQVSGGSGRLVVSTMSGQIFIAGGPFDRVDAVSVSGDVRLDLDLSTTAVASVSSHSGQIAVAWRGPARVSAQTFSGAIINARTDDAVQPDIIGQSLNIVHENAPRITLETFSGDIRIQEKR